jgi:hypothetical protein
MTKLEAIRIMLEIVTECDKYDSEGNSCKTCPFGSDEGSCMVSEGNDIPHNWQIKDKLREI